jgi:quercetin dioxygenase-like cupin family protein
VPGLVDRRAREAIASRSPRRYLMRLRFTTLAATAALALLLAPLAARAQDPLKVAPDKFKVLFENDQVRVLDYNGKAGEKLAMHSHPDHVIYNVTGGKTKFTTADGKSQEMESKTGEATWVPATTHAAEHHTDVHGILIELKKPKK